jgi:hypothetical protein
MNLTKYLTQKKAGLASPIQKVGPDTVWLAQSAFDPNTGAQVASTVEQLNLAGIDEAIDQQKAAAQTAADAIAALTELRADIAAALA